MGDFVVTKIEIPDLVIKQEEEVVEDEDEESEEEV